MTDEPTVVKPKKKKKMIPVRVIFNTGPSATVEYLQKGHLVRVTIPVVEIGDDMVDEEILDAGVPYGEPWEEMKIPSISSQALADELRRQGIWCHEDAQKNVRGVQGAVQTIVGPLVTSILKFSRQESGQSEET